MATKHFFYPLACLFLAATVPLRAADFSLQILVNQRDAQRGDTVSATIRLLNQGKTAGTGMLLRIDLADGLRLLAPSASLGKFDAATGLWHLENIPANLESAELSLQLIPEAEGPFAIRAEIQAANETDTDSQPGNAKIGEDDLAFGYVAVPIVFCGNEPVRLRAEALAGFTGYRWFRDGQAIPGANQPNLQIDRVGRYTCRVAEIETSEEGSFPVIVRQSEAVAVTLPPSFHVCAGEILNVRADVSAGKTPFKYDWQNSLNADLNVPLKAGTNMDLTVTVTDAAGCRGKALTKILVENCPGN